MSASVGVDQYRLIIPWCLCLLDPGSTQVQSAHVCLGMSVRTPTKGQSAQHVVTSLLVTANYSSPTCDWKLAGMPWQLLLGTKPNWWWPTTSRVKDGGFQKSPFHCHLRLRFSKIPFSLISPMKVFKNPILTDISDRGFQNSHFQMEVFKIPFSLIFQIEVFKNPIFIDISHGGLQKSHFHWHLRWRFPKIHFLLSYQMEVSKTPIFATSQMEVSKNPNSHWHLRCMLPNACSSQVADCACISKQYWIRKRVCLLMAYFM